MTASTKHLSVLTVGTLTLLAVILHSSTFVYANQVETTETQTGGETIPVESENSPEGENSLLLPQSEEPFGDSATSTPVRPPNLQNPVNERQVTLQARGQERVTNLAANMSNRMEAVTARLENIAKRIETRINKLAAAGIDTQNAAAGLASARMSIEKAQTEIATIDAAVLAAVSSEDFRASWQTLKARYTIIKDHLKTAHTELRNALLELKVAVAAGATDSSNPDTQDPS